MAESKQRRQPRFQQITVMLLMTAFQLICAACVLSRQETPSLTMIYILFGYIAAEWLYLLIGNLVTGNDYFELEAIAFFLSGLGLTLCASFSEAFAFKQLVAIGLGLAAYLLILLLIKNMYVVRWLRYPAAIGSIGVLALNLLLAQVHNGALNWIDLGPVSIQPSELVKVVFIFVGAVTLEKLLSTKALWLYIGYALVCVGCLFLMRDFGTALIFFFTFILIAFMRSGNIRTLVLICAVALMGAMLVIYFKPYVAKRFAAFRHVWEYADSLGYQQTRVLMYSASGGLLGLGLGEGYLRGVYAVTTDLIFGLINEELGIFMGVAVVLSFVGIAFFAVKTAKSAGSTFYAIAAVAAAGMLLFQMSLNVFGVTDLLPLTGVTLPFVSRGGSSMICSWGLLAYIRAAGAPFVPPRPDIAVSKRLRRAPKGGAPV